MRFFALLTLLNLPPEMLPDVILLDEPELGLRPTAVDLVAEMVKSVGRAGQVLVATRSPLFVDAFGLDQVIVLDLDQGETVLRQLVPARYAERIRRPVSTATSERRPCVSIRMATSEHSRTRRLRKIVIGSTQLSGRLGRLGEFWIRPRAAVASQSRPIGWAIQRSPTT